RKGPASRRPLTPDPIYQSQLVTQMVNKILLQGKRSTAERIVYSALEQCRRKTGNDPVTQLKGGVGEGRAGGGDKEPPGRRAHLPGPGRGPPGPLDHPGPALAGQLLPRPPREDHGRPPGRPTAGRLR